MRDAVRYFSWLWRHHRGALVAVLTLTLAATLAATSLPLILRDVFDALAQGDAGARRSIRLYAIIAATEFTLLGSLMFLRGVMNDRFQWLARSRAFEALARRGPAFLQRFRTGDLVTRLTDDAGDKLSWFACSGIFRAVAAALLISFAAFHMLRLDPWMALVTALPAPLLALLHVKTGHALSTRWTDVQQRISSLNDRLEACFSGVRVVKAYGREPAEEQGFARAAASCRDAELSAARLQAMMDSLHGHAWQVGVAGILLLGGLRVLSGKITLGTLVAFDNYVLMLVFPMLDLGTFIVRGRQGSACIDRLLELEREPPAIVEPAAPAVLPRGPAALAFEGVAVAHGTGASRREILRGVSFAVRPGEMIAVVGRVGSGKTSLLRLPPRLVDPDAGRVTLAGLDLRALRLADLRRSVGVAFQERTLFSGTVRDNVRFWRDHVTDDDVAWAVSVARLGSDLSGFAKGLETMVGVRGVTLSGGQQQRVALARALAGRPRVLVLDDITSALDAETEAALWAELGQALPDAAVLVVTHRLSTLERADRIVVLDDGGIVETGTHRELWREGTAYREIYLSPAPRAGGR